jgi:hypothetical protein
MATPSGCYLRSPQARAVLCVYLVGSRRLRRFRPGYAGISEDLQTRSKGDGRGGLVGISGKSPEKTSNEIGLDLTSFSTALMRKAGLTDYESFMFRFCVVPRELG